MNDNITSQIIVNDSVLDSPFDFVIGEIGNATMNHNQKTINFAGKYENPVVLATSLTRNGHDPATVRFTDISGSSFTAFIEEPNYLAPGKHGYESFSYVVIEAGTYELSDGTLIEANTINSHATTKKNWQSIEFENDFESAPVILSQVQTNRGGDFVRTRIQNVNPDGFKLAMEEEESLLLSGHVTETIGFLAISEGSGTWGDSLYQAGNTGNVVTHSNHLLEFDDFNQAPNFIASVGSYNGPDSVGVRHHSLSADGIKLMLDEDSSKDKERLHTREVVNFLAIEGDGFLTGALTDFELPEIQVTAAGENIQISNIPVGAEIEVSFGGDANNGFISFTGDAFFDGDYYLAQNPDVAAAGVNPLQHYYQFGFREGRDPNILFDTDYYLEQNPDVAAAGVNPLQHYYEFGSSERRNPSAAFDSSYYAEQNPDVVAAGVNLLQHYFEFGRSEGRSPNQVFDSFNRSEVIFAASANLSDENFQIFKDSALANNPGTEVAVAPAIPIVIYYIYGAIAITAVTPLLLENANNIQELIQGSDIGVYTSTPPFDGSLLEDDVPGGFPTGEGEVPLTTPPFDLGEATKIDKEIFPSGNQYLENILDGQFEFPLDDELFIFFDAAGTEGNIIGDLREERVAEIVGGTLAKDSNGQDIKLTAPGVSKSVPIDVFGPNGELILVGGPKKVEKLDKLGGTLRDLVIVAEDRGVKALHYFTDNTPEAAIKAAQKKLGAENVFTFPEVTLP